MSRRSAPDADFGEATATIEWLMGDEARRYATKLVAGSGLDRGLADDLIQMAAVKVIRRSRSPQAEAIDNPAAYGTTVVRNAFVNLQRGRKLTEVELEDAVLVDELQVGSIDDDVELQMMLDGADAADPIRVAIETQHLPLWVRSAALTVATLAVHGTVDVEQLPSPQSGARSDQALYWPALHLAGRDDLFDPDAPAALRKRRSRYIKQVRAAIDAAFIEAAARGEVQRG